MENSTAKTQEQLLNEIEELRERIAKFESLKSKDQASENKKTWFWQKQSKKKFSTNEQVSDETFRLIAKNTGDAISLHTFNLKAPYTYVSPAMERLSGYKAEALLSKSPFDFMHPDDQKKLYSILKDYVNKKVKKLFTGGEDVVSEKFDFRFKTKSGEWRHFQSTGNISGKQLLFVSRDITEQKQMQEALLQSENKYRQLFDQTADATLIIKDNKFVDCNEATVSMLGYNNKQHIINKHPSEISPESQPDGKSSFEKANEMMAIAFNNGSHRFEWEHKKADGEVFPVEVLLTAIQIGEEKFLHSVWHDITSRKLSELELGKSEERFKRLFEDLGSAVYVTKIGGENAGQILEANIAAVKHTGYTKDELLTMNIINDFKVVDSGDMNTEYLEDKLLKGETVTAVEKKRRKNGSEYWTEVIVTLIEYKKERAGLSINHDITKRKYAEDALRSIATQFSAITGFEFIEKVCKHITQTLNIDYAFAGILSSNKDTVFVKAGIGKGKPIKQFEYLLKDTPCNNVMEKSDCCYPTGVQNSFPKDVLLSEMNIDSYMGVPLFSSSGDALGIMVLLDSKPMDNEEVASSLLQIFSDRIAAEMERMDTEEELRISEEKFRNLYQNTPIMLHSIDREGRLISVSNHWLKMMGYTEDEVIGVKSTEFLTEASRKYAINEVLPNFFITGIINDVPYEFVRKDGEIINVLMSAISEKNQLGEVLRSMAVLVDVTEARKSQLALIETDNLLRKSQKVASLGTYMMDITTGSWESSLILDDIFGIDENQEKNLEIWVQVLHPDDRDMMQNYFATNVLKNHEPFNKEYRIKRINDGQVRWVHGLGELEFNDDGNPVKMIGTIQDITDRKYAEEAIRESEEKYRELIEGTKNLITRVDKDGNFTFVNQISNEFFGLRPEECVGLNAFDFVYKDDKQRTIEWFDSMINLKETNGTIENRQINKKTGEVFNLLWTCNLQYNDDGTILGMSAIAKDLTAFNQAQEALTQERQRLSYILEGTNAGTWDWNVQTGELSLNTRWAEIMGYTLEELEPIDINTWINNVHPDDLTNANTLLEDHLGGKTDYYDVEFRQPHKDGTWVWVSARGKVTQWKDDGKPLRMSGIHTDISDRKAVAENLKSALDKATESDRLKSAFLATMSHELRTPLNAIIGFTNLISEEIPFDEVLNYNKIVNSSGNHLLTIVEDLFDITLIEAGEIKIQNQPEDIHTILGEVHDIIKGEQQITKKQHLDLNLIIPEGRKNLITSTDSVKLKQILINLLKNALKFTPGGHVHFGYEIEKDKNQPLIKFFVEDTGIGISIEKQELIFDIFRQVEDSHTRIYGGTGIGLSIARKLTNLLGGSIWLESDIATHDKKSGTTFYFTIPYEEIETAIEPTIKKVTKDLIRKKDSNKEKIILIVEDDKDSYDFLNIVCKNAKINTLWAEDGIDAIEICKENADIDLVLMDINMPIMNGYEATKEIKKFNPELPIIAQTAYAISGDREKAMEVGCDDYISKPIKKDELMIKINKLLGV